MNPCYLQWCLLLNKVNNASQPCMLHITSRFSNSNQPPITLAYLAAVTCIIRHKRDLRQPLRQNGTRSRRYAHQNAAAVAAAADGRDCLLLLPLLRWQAVFGSSNVDVKSCCRCRRICTVFLLLLLLLLLLLPLLLLRQNFFLGAHTLQTH